MRHDGQSQGGGLFPCGGFGEDLLNGRLSHEAGQPLGQFLALGGSEAVEVVKLVAEVAGEMFSPRGIAPRDPPGSGAQVGIGVIEGRQDRLGVRAGGGEIREHGEGSPTDAGGSMTQAGGGGGSVANFQQGVGEGMIQGAIVRGVGQGFQQGGHGLGIADAAEGFSGPAPLHEVRIAQGSEGFLQAARIPFQGDPLEAGQRFGRGSLALLMRSNPLDAVDGPGHIRLHKLRGRAADFVPAAGVHHQQRTIAVLQHIRGMKV